MAGAQQAGAHQAGAQQAGVNEMNKEEYIARDYQIELLQKALKENIILYLPTGSGKTFIAVMLIKRLSQDLERPIQEGGQRIFFAVNTVALVKQQGDYIARHTHLTVGKYSGDMNVDNWKADQWEIELLNNQVIVLTCQILLDMLEHGFVQLENINLIIFDECHHAVSDHCMRRVMQKFENCPKELQPRVLGLSATLLNANCKSSKVADEIKSLENTFQAKVATVDDIKLVKPFSTNPGESIINYENGYSRNSPSYILALQSEVLSEIESAKIILEMVKSSVFSVEDDNVPNSSKIQSIYQTAGSREKKKLKSIFTDVEKMVEDLGVYGGYWAALSAIVSLHRRRLAMTTEDGKLIITGLITNLVMIRRIISTKMDRYSEFDRISKFSTCKVLKLLELLLECENSSRSSSEQVSLREQLQAKKNGPVLKSCALIFVERRQTAKTLYQILKNASKHCPGLQSVIPEFVVGVAAKPTSCESALNNRRHHEAIKKFRNGECNYLIASDVMEEGVDIPLCALVVKLDLPKTFRSYVQSKGRARHATSRYIMFVPEDANKFYNSLQEFRNIEKMLKQILIGKTDSRELPSEDEVKDILYQQDIPPYYADDGIASVTTISAVALINRYCSLLPQDKFSQLRPLWLLNKNAKVLLPNPLNAPVSRRLAFLQLPINSPLRNIVKGLPMENTRLAKRAVAIMTCVALHRMGELGNDLLPTSYAPEVLDDTSLFPHWKNESKDDGLPGSKKKIRVYSKQVAEALIGCHPKPGIASYVYHINQTTIYEKPAIKDSRGTAMYNVLNMKHGYAIISAKELPEVCEFPIFVSSGEIAVNIRQEESLERVFLTSKEIKELEQFHYMIFFDLLKICKQFIIVDKSHSTNSYLIGPTCTDASGKWTIDWDIVRRFSELPVIEPPSKDEVENLIVNNENYLYQVVTPWYRDVITERHYVVTRVCDDMNARSPFPSSTYDSFEKYFDDKYGLEVFKPELPLLEVKAISNSKDCIHPRGKSVPFDDNIHLSKRQMILKHGDFNEHLIPELVTQRKYPATLWVKAIALPTVLHRLSCMLLAHELRTQVCLEAQIGIVEPPSGKKWKPLSVESKNILDEVNIRAPSARPTKSLPTKKTECHLVPELIDLDRKIEKLCLIDIMQFYQLEKEGNNSPVVSGYEWCNIEPASVPVEVLNRLENSNPVLVGPELADVVKALTGASAGDVFNLERLETLGDSFLKFAASTYLYLKYPKLDEGKLTSIKGKLISNRNLLYCGEKKCLGGKLKTHPFSPNSDWNPPGFVVPPFLKEKLSDHGGITNDVLFKLTIPEDDRLSGHLSKDTRSDINESLEESKTNNTIGKMSSTMEAILGKQSVPDKNIADCVEALIGSWLLTGGSGSALCLLGWFGILPHGPNGPARTWEELIGDETLKSIKDGFIKDQDGFKVIGGRVDWVPDFQHSYIIDEGIDPRSCRSTKNGLTTDCLEELLPSADRIEKLINYRFKNRCLLLQALTHASYHPNRLTDCYQRLEFLGDAVLDYIITCHIFETCGNLSPGQLTDLRSALVNNITFASLVVRHGLHRHLLHLSPSLMEAIDTFVDMQVQRNHAVTEECLVLMEEEDCKLSESVEVPKALGDIMESLAGAIFLDSGLSLRTVWEVFYPVMKKEIDAFSKCVPKQPVRELLETYQDSYFWPPEIVPSEILDEDAKPLNVSKNIMMVSVDVRDKKTGKLKTFHGFGERKSLAKRAAAKLALRGMERF